MALQFPTRRIAPEQDVTEMAMHRAIDIAHDFEHAIVEAQSVGRCLQLRERITACIAWLQEAEGHAMDKADRF